MASARIHVINDASHIMGGRVLDCVNLLAAARKSLNEMALVWQKYAGDVTAITADYGLTTADQTAFNNLLLQASNELNGLATTAVALNQPTGTRQLIDALSTGG